MGWYESVKHGGVMLGDDAYDVSYEYLKRLSEIYQEAHGRKVTLDEVRVLLQIALRVSGDEFLEGFDTQQVTDVAVRTASRRKKQGYKPGDLFVIPLGEGYSAYGRVMKEKTALGVLVEIFSEASRGIKESVNDISSERLFHPVYTFGIPFEKWEWTVVASDDEYECEDCDQLRFAMGDKSSGYKIVQGGKSKPASAAEIEGLEQTVIWNGKVLEKRIRKELEQQGLWPRAG